MENCKARFQSRSARRIIGFVTVADMDVTPNGLRAIYVRPSDAELKL